MSGGGALVLLILLSAVVSGPATIVVRAANSPAEQAFAALQGTDVVEPAPRRQISPEQLQEIEAGLLKMFGLSSRPRPPKGKVHIPPYLLELYNNHVSNPHRTSLNFKVSNLDTLSANTIRSFFHKGKKCQFVIAPLFITVPADALAPNGSKLPAGTVMTMQNLTCLHQGSLGFELLSNIALCWWVDVILRWPVRSRVITRHFKG